MSGQRRPLPKVETFKERQRLKFNGTLPKFDGYYNSVQEAWAATGIDKDRSVLHDQ